MPRGVPHASETTGSVAAAKDDFCVSCHSYAAVKIDCFDCHSTKPQGSIAMHSLNAETAHYKHKLAAQVPTFAHAVSGSRLGKRIFDDRRQRNSALRDKCSDALEVRPIAVDLRT